VTVLLGHEDETVRKLACVTLGQLGSASVLRELREASKDPTTAEEALQALRLLAPDERPPTN
jgi:HEAT repeat protein